MTEMTKQERVRAALAGKPVDHAPVALWRHDFLREWTPEELVATTLEAYRADDWDFIKFNPRATYFAEAWGNRSCSAPSGSVRSVWRLSRATHHPRRQLYFQDLPGKWLALLDMRNFRRKIRANRRVGTQISPRRDLVAAKSLANVGIAGSRPCATLATARPALMTDASR